MRDVLLKTEREHLGVINYLPLGIQMNLNILVVISTMYPATQFRLQAEQLFKMQRRFANIKVFNSGL